VTQIGTADVAAWEQLKRDSGTSSSGSSTPATPSTPPGIDADAPVQKDWKGDPIKFNPGKEAQKGAAPAAS
jgi:hypothetical protein